MSVTNALKLPDAGNSKFDGSGAKNTEDFRVWLTRTLKCYDGDLAKILAGVLSGKITPDAKGCAASKQRQVDAKLLVKLLNEGVHHVEARERAARRRGQHAVVGCWESVHHI